LKTGTFNESFIGSRAWLLPATFLTHIAEEYWGGFPKWIARFWGVESSNADFLVWNGAAWLFMTLCVALVLKSKSYDWLLVGLATAVLINGSAHAVASIATTSYSPGLVTGSLFFIPLGAVTLRGAREKLNRRTFWAGLCVGVLLHMTVVLFAFGFARASA
jgi:hypothetical protein